jgi:hypothetical protein
MRCRHAGETTEPGGSLAIPDKRLVPTRVREDGCRRLRVKVLDPTRPQAPKTPFVAGDRAQPRLPIFGVVMSPGRITRYRH